MATKTWGSSTILDRGCFTPWEGAPSTKWIGGWVGPRATVDAVEHKKNLFPMPGIEPQLSSL
jgi:hypothetical protein